MPGRRQVPIHVQCFSWCIFNHYYYYQHYITIINIIIIIIIYCHYIDCLILHFLLVFFCVLRTGANFVIGF
jgi:hypothetical protein